MPPAGPTRRAALLAAALLAAPRRAGATVPEAATLLVPGPEEGVVARWAGLAAAGLARGLVQASALRVAVLGGPDGITAANRFASAAAPDGRALLLLPGAAAQAQLVGDSRARFEPRHWPPLLALMRPVLVAGRMPLPDPGAAPLRLALTAPEHPDTAALLALESLGRRVTPVFGLPGPQAESAIAQGAVDALVVATPRPMPRIAALGLHPWFTAGPRDASLPGLAGLREMAADMAPSLLQPAWEAGFAACATPGLVVLPALTPADAVALWRGAARAWAEAEPASEAGRHLAGAEARAVAAMLTPPAEVAVAYREWLARRLGWRAT